MRRICLEMLHIQDKHWKWVRRFGRGVCLTKSGAGAFLITVVSKIVTREGANREKLTVKKIINNEMFFFTVYIPYKPWKIGVNREKIGTKPWKKSAPKIHHFFTVSFSPFTSSWVTPEIFRNEKAAQRGSFRAGHPTEIRGSFARISQPQTSVRALKILEKQSFGRGYPWPEGADIHDPKGFPNKLRSEKLRAEFSFPRLISNWLGVG